MNSVSVTGNSTCLVRPFFVISAAMRLLTRVLPVFVIQITNLCDASVSDMEQPEVVKLFLSMGADPEYKDWEGAFMELSLLLHKITTM